MTNKEAIELIENDMRLHHDYLSGKYRHALRMAVDALKKADRKTEPQTCEECEHWNDTEDGCADRHGCKTEPHTERK